jgi:hypothetical protein
MWQRGKFVFNLNKGIVIVSQKVVKYFLLPSAMYKNMYLTWRYCKVSRRGDIVGLEKAQSVMSTTDRLGQS